LRELSVAEQAYKRSNAEKDLARVQAAEDKLQAHEQNYIKALNDGVARKIDLFKDQRQRETQIETAKIGRSATLGAAEISARAPGAEQKLLETIHAEEVAKNPNNPPTMAETYERIKTSSGKAEGRAKIVLALEKEWMDIMGDITGESLRKVKAMYPNVETGDDYIREKMKVVDEFSGRPGTQGKSGAQGNPVVVQTPQGAVQFNSQAEADAFKKKFGLK
jgi:hypothetical protein